MQNVTAGNNVPNLSNRDTSFVSFNMDPNSDGLVAVSIRCLSWTPTTAQLYPFRAAAILPLPVVSGSTVTVKVDKPRQICVIINGITDSPLCIFADPDESLPLPSQSDPNVVYFGPGTWNPANGIINIQTGQTLYLAGGAHVFARVALSSDSIACSQTGLGVRIMGRGVLDGHNFVINADGPSLISVHCTGLLVQGIIMINSPQYHVDNGGYPYTRVQWAKAISWGYSMHRRLQSGSSGPR